MKAKPIIIGFFVLVGAARIGAAIDPPEKTAVVKAKAVEATTTTIAPATTTTAKPTTTTTVKTKGWDWTVENLALHVFEESGPAIAQCMAERVFLYAKSKAQWDRTAPSERDYVLNKAIRGCNPKYGGNPSPPVG